jgi:LmbE family N-acetylglucosaminyl deacetylase
VAEVMRALLIALVFATAAGAVPHRPGLVAVFGHPDDEILIAGFLVEAVRRGFDVRAVYLTSGDAGKDRSGRGLVKEALRSERERELTTALTRLGLPPPILLRFPDGEVWARRAEVRPVLARTLSELAPRVMVTFGPDGVTGHADHVAAGALALEAFDATGAGDEAWTFAVSTRRVAGLEGRLTQFPVLPVDRRRVDLTVDVSAIVATRIASMKAHHTQFPADVQELLAGWFTRFPTDELIRVRGTGAHVRKKFERSRRR